jgi:hypothetical protein
MGGSVRIQVVFMVQIIARSVLLSDLIEVRILGLFRYCLIKSNCILQFSGQPRSSVRLSSFMCHGEHVGFSISGQVHVSLCSKSALNQATSGSMKLNLWCRLIGSDRICV